jgi:hypothetical protein
VFDGANRMEPETRADRDNPVYREGRGQVVGLYVRLHWRGTTALPIRQHRGFCGSQYSSGARSWAAFSRPYCRCPPAYSTPVMFPGIDPMAGWLCEALRDAVVTVTT